MISAIQTSDGTSGDNRGAKALVLVLAFFCASLHSKAPKAPFFDALEVGRRGGRSELTSLSNCDLPTSSRCFCACCKSMTAWISMASSATLHTAAVF